MGVASGAIEAGRAFIRLGVSDEFSAALATMEGKLKSVGANLKAAGADLLKVGVAMATPFVLAVNYFKNFDREMSKVGALTLATGASFDALEKEARRLGATTIYSAQDAAEAMRFFALAGYDVQKILAATGPTLNLAAAGSLDIAKAADIVAKVLASTGMGTEELGNAVDVLTKAMTTANTDLLQMGEAFRYVGSISKQVGMEMEETTAAIQMLSNSGLQAEMAGTALRGVIVALASPSELARKTLNDLGIVTKDTKGNFRSLADILQNFEEATKGLGKGEVLDMLGKIFDTRQITGMAELLVQGSDRLRQFTQALRQSGGTAGFVANAQIKSLWGQFEILTSAAQELAIAVGEALSEKLKKVSAYLAETVNSMSVWVSANRDAVVALTELVVAIVAVGGALLGLGIALKMGAIAIGGYVAAIHGLKAAYSALAVSVAVGTRLLDVFLGVRSSFLGMTTAMVQGAAILGATTLAITAMVSVSEALYVHVAKVNDEMQRLREKGDEVRESSMGQLQQLVRLSQRQSLTTAELQSAYKVLEELKSKYGDVGITIDSTTGTIIVAADAFKRLADSMNKVRNDQLNNEIDEIMENIRELNKEAETALETEEYWNPFSSDEKRAQKILDLQKRRNEQFDKLREAQARLRNPLEAHESGVKPSGTPSPEETEALRKDAEERVKLAEDLKELRIRAVQDEHDREIGLINHKYDVERRKAIDENRSNETLNMIEQNRAQELSNKEAELSRDRQEEEIKMNATIAEAKAKGIQDDYQRELRMIDIREKAEKDIAALRGDAARARTAELTAQAEREAADLDEKVRQQDKLDKQAEANADRQDEVEQLKLKLKYRGAELDKKLLDIEEKTALRKADKEGENLDLVKEEFDLRRKILDAGAQMQSTIGTFNGNAISQLGEDPEQIRIRIASEKSAEYLKKLAQSAKPMVFF